MMRRLLFACLLFLVLDPHFSEAATRMEVVQVMNPPSASLMMPQSQSQSQAQSESQSQSNNGNGGTPILLYVFIIVGIIQIVLAIKLSSFRKLRSWVEKNSVGGIDFVQEVNSRSHSPFLWIGIFVVVIAVGGQIGMAYLMESSTADTTMLGMSLVCCCVISLIVLAIMTGNKHIFSRRIRRQVNDYKDVRSQVPTKLKDGVQDSEIHPHLAQKLSEINPHHGRRPSTQQLRKAVVERRRSSTATSSSSGHTNEDSENTVVIRINSGNPSGQKEEEQHETPQGPENTCQYDVAKASYDKLYEGRFDIPDLFTRFMSMALGNEDLNASLLQARVALAIECVAANGFRQEQGGRVSVKIGNNQKYVCGIGAGLFRAIGKLNADQMQNYVKTEDLKLRAPMLKSLCSDEGDPGQQCCPTPKSSVFCGKCGLLTQAIEQV